MGILTLIHNIRYLMRYNIKNMNKDIQVAKNGLDFIKYEITDDLKDIFIPNIMNRQESIDYIINNKVSVSRFGDGEFNLIKNVGIPFQKSSPVLAERLKEILVSGDENIKIGIPYGIFHTTNGASERSKNFVRNFGGKNTDWIVKLLDKNYTYINAGFTILPNSKEEYEKIREIWNNRDVTVISGDRVFKKIEFNVFDNAKSIEYINAPTVNAFGKYDEILEKAKLIPKDRLVAIILGPTATVLAYDLAKLGYQALDLGHIVKSYDAFNKQHEITSNYLNSFWGKD